MTFIIAEDAALKSHLSGITVSDEKDSNRAVNVWFGFPDVEIRAQKFPFIVIELVDIRHATYRQHAGIIYDTDMQGTVAPVSNYSYSYESPLAYDLVYQVSSYSRHPRHDRALMFQLHQKFPSQRGSLAVPDALGDSTSYRHMSLEEFMKLDRAEGENGNKRLLRNVYTVRVTSEMTPATASTAIKSIQSVNINSHGAIVPWVLSIPEDKTAI